MLWKRNRYELEYCLLVKHSLIPFLHYYPRTKLENNVYVTFSHHQEKIIKSYGKNVSLYLKVKHKENTRLVPLLICDGSRTQRKENIIFLFKCKNDMTSFKLRFDENK